MSPILISFLKISKLGESHSSFSTCGFSMGMKRQRQRHNYVPWISFKPQTRASVTCRLACACVNRNISHDEVTPEGINCRQRNMGPARSLHQLSGVVFLVSHHLGAGAFLPHRFFPFPHHFRSRWEFGRIYQEPARGALSFYFPNTAGAH